MNSAQKTIQYLNEAHATEQALTRTLQAHIAMTPRGAYRTDLERHLRETKSHATASSSGWRSSARVGAWSWQE